MFLTYSFLLDEAVSTDSTESSLLKQPLFCTGDKTNKMSVRPAKTQISLGFRPVWSESSLSAWRNLGSLATHWAHSEDWVDAQAVWVFAGRTVTLLVLSCRGSYIFSFKPMEHWPEQSWKPALIVRMKQREVTSLTTELPFHCFCFVTVLLLWKWRFFYFQRIIIIYCQEMYFGELKFGVINILFWNIIHWFWSC